MARLQVFVERACCLCSQAMEIAAQAQAWFPALSVEVVDLSEVGDAVPDFIVAVPTYTLDGQVLSLGNPRPAALMHVLAARLARCEDPRHDATA
ncbi:MAG: hypothetical protein C4290_05855 [Chloroflexota bacterium]